jgi:hypothetical protein
MADEPEVKDLTALFKLRDGSISDPVLAELYDGVVDRLRTDAGIKPGFALLEDLMVERVAFLYIWIRDREAMGIGLDGDNKLASTDEPDKKIGFVHERNYRETLSMWWSMAHTLQGAQARTLQAQQVKEAVLKRVGKVIADTCDSMNVEVGQPLKEKFVEAFDQAGDF